MQPFSVLKTFVGEKAQDTSLNLSNKMGSWMNRFYENVWMTYNWKEITTIDDTFTVVAAKTVQLLPKEAVQIISLTNREINAVLQPASPFVYQQKYLGMLGAVAAPVAYSEAGRSPVATNLSGADTVTFVSDNASDVHNIRITGLDANSLIRSETVTLTGTTPAVGLITFKADGLIDIVQAQRSSGIITITKTTGGAVLDRIGTEDYKNEYIQISLQGPATSAQDIFASYKQRFRPLRYPEDVPRFNCGEALVLYAYAQILKTREKFDQALVEERSANAIIGALVAERDIMGANDYESTMPKVSTNATDVPYFGGAGYYRTGGF